MPCGAEKNARASGASNVIALTIPQHRQSLATRLAAHAKLFARSRRGQDDVFWLKENAEYLNILECSGLSAASALETYEPIYDRIEERLGEFPQYYRFHLSICLDLEDIGMPGTKGEALCRWAADQGLAEAELSDLQRAEASRLLARRDIAQLDDELIERLHRFADRSRTFAIPNRKAAYELTHVAFYLSEYGRKEPELSADALQSLCFAGLLAFLDQDMDLLAEICVALRCTGHTPSAIWENAVLDALATSESRAQDPSLVADDYHTYLVSNWLSGMTRGTMMPLPLKPTDAFIRMAPPAARALRDLSVAVADIRNDDWHSVRGRVTARMDRASLDVLQAAERSTDMFGTFFAHFARKAGPHA